ncbi:MAG: VanZ family protein [Paludibacteraceae bacterium]
MVNFIQNYWKSIVITGIIFLLSTINFSTTQEIVKFKYSDKLVHIAMYAALGFTLMYDYANDINFKHKHAHFHLVILLFPFLFGGIIEIVQQVFFPPRTAEWMDWVADIAGILLGGVCAHFLLKKTKTNG